VLFSSTFRARLRVFLSKHFFKYKYDYRQEWLRFTGTLSSEDASVPFEQRAIRAIGELVESPGGLLWVRRDDGSFVLDGVTDLGDPDYPPEEPGSPLVDFLERSGWIIDLNEYRSRPGLYHGLRLPDWLLGDERHWAVVPLLKGEDLQGFVVLTTPLAPHRIDWEARDLLKTAGRQLAVYVALAETHEALVEARQFETFHRLTAFLIHDMKNVSAQLSLICANAERHRNNPDFVADAFATVANARDRLERTQAQLRNVQPRLETPRQVIAVQDLLEEIVAGSQTAQPIPELEIRESAEILGDREALKNLLLHLVRNAQEATPDAGRIQLSLSTDGPLDHAPRAGYRVRHRRGIPPPSPVPAIPDHQGQRGHGDRSVRSARPDPAHGRADRRAQQGWRGYAVHAPSSDASAAARRSRRLRKKGDQRWVMPGNP
jgi:putative PEP-CTERM system histidine kinase